MSEQEQKEVRDFEIHSLAPQTLHDDEYKVYGDVLDRVTRDKSVCNIALTGEYGSGKSSVVETFLSKRSVKNDVIRISLRNFDVENAKDGLEALEKKIIQQMICQLDPKVVHMAGIPTKQHGENQHFKDGFKYVTGIGFILGYCYLLTRIPYMEELLGIFLPTFAFLPKLFAFAVAGAMGFVCYQLHRWIQKLPWGTWATKLTCAYKESELSLELHKDDIKKSLFDTYMDEIVYLFEKAKIRYVVIEDLDRYDNLKIFEQLREINFLLNVGEKLDENGKPREKVRFFYLLKDSIFGNNGLDRTKFFDAIIPVVPCIGESNAWEKLLALCPILKEKLSVEEQRRLEGFCSAHLDDYRMIKNIANEMQIMMNRNDYYKIFDLDTKKMLGMVIYRNMFPQDYEMLYHKSGYIYGCFQSRIYLVENTDKKYDDYFDMMLNTMVLYHPEYRLNLTKEYWDGLKKHKEYWMLAQLVNEKYIEEKDYQRYMRATDVATDTDEKLNAYYRDIVSGEDVKELFYDTEISREIWQELTQRLQSDNFKSKGILNKYIIDYMLDEYSECEGQDNADEQFWLENFANVAGVCPDDLKIRLFNELKEENKYDWASLSWYDNMKLWEKRKELTEQEIEYVLAVLYDSSNRIEDYYEWLDMNSMAAENEDDIWFAEEDEFLQFLYAHHVELLPGLVEDAEVLRVFLELTGYWERDIYQISDVAPFMHNTKALSHIWSEKRFIINEENLITFIRKSPDAKITLSTLKELDFDFYKKCLQKENVEKFVKELYVDYMLPHVRESKDGTGSEEILQLLRHDALPERYKTEILAKMPKAASFKDITKVPENYKENVRHMGHSAVNMLYVLRKLGYKPDEANIQFMEECYQLSKQKSALYYPGLPKVLSEGEAFNIRKGLKKAKLKTEVEEWVLDEFGITVYVGDDDGIAG